MRSNITDNRIIAGLKAGNENAINDCIEKYGAYVAFIVSNVIGDTLTREDREEVTADVFITVWKNRERIDIDHSGSFKGLIGTIARNLSKNKLRDLGHTLTTEEINDSFPDKIDIENELIKRELQNKMLNCIRNFDRTDRICFIHYYYYHKRIKDIGRELGLSESAVKSKLLRGRKKIRGVLQQEVMEHEI